jgi:peptidoglycan/LPS O-acetylase OafA/YrhL
MVVLFLTIRVPGRFWGALGTATFGAYLIHLLVVRLVMVQLGDRLPFPVFVFTCGAVTFAAVLGFQFIRARWGLATGVSRLVSFLPHPD